MFLAPPHLWKNSYPWHGPNPNPKLFVLFLLDLLSRTLQAGDSKTVSSPPSPTSLCPRTPLDLSSRLHLRHPLLSALARPQLVPLSFLAVPSAALFSPSRAGHVARVREDKLRPCPKSLPMHSISSLDTPRTPHIPPNRAQVLSPSSLVLNDHREPSTRSDEKPQPRSRAPTLPFHLPPTSSSIMCSPERVFALERPRTAVNLARTRHFRARMLAAPNIFFSLPLHRLTHLSSVCL